MDEDDLPDYEAMLEDPAPDPPPEPKIEYLNTLSQAPTVFADGLVFVSRIGTTVRLSFVETTLEPNDSRTPGIKSKHVVNVVMPMEGFQNAVSYVDTIIRGWAEIDSEKTAHGDQSAH